MTTSAISRCGHDSRRRGRFDRRQILPSRSATENRAQAPQRNFAQLPRDFTQLGGAVVAHAAAQLGEDFGAVATGGTDQKDAAEFFLIVEVALAQCLFDVA